MDEAYTLRCEIKSLNKIFRRACQQVILLNNRIEEMKARYDRARSLNRRSFRYTNRLKLCVIEGVRNMYYEFACTKCDEIEEKQTKLRTMTGEDFDFSMESDEERDNGDEERRENVDDLQTYQNENSPASSGSSDDSSETTAEPEPECTGTSPEPECTSPAECTTPVPERSTPVPQRTSPQPCTSSS